MSSSTSTVVGDAGAVSEAKLEDSSSDVNPTQLYGSQDVEKATSVPLPDDSTDFLVSFTGDDDPRSPRSFSTLRKWLIVFIVSTTSLCVACTSSLYTGTYGQIKEEFHASEIVATLGLSMFVVGLGISPLVLAPLSEFYGRKPVYILSMLFFIIWIIPCAVAKNAETLIVARFFDGFAGSAFLSVAGGTIGDLFPSSKLQAPMMVYTVSPFLGPELGPVLGNLINYHVDWRWSFYVLLIWAATQLAAISLVPETYHPVLLRNEARKLRKETGDNRYYAAIERTERTVAQTVIHSCYRPFLLLALEPMCLFLCIFCSFLLGVLYLFFGAFNLVFADNHGFNLWQVGLSFLGITVGMLLGICTNPLWDRNYARLRRKHEAATGGKPGSSEPEFRLPPAIGGAPLVAIGLLWFGWSTYPSVHWIVPIVGSAVFGAGVIMVFSGVFTFLVDAYPLYAASALAANSFARSMFAAGFPLFGPTMFRNLGYQWASFVLAVITLLLAPFPYIFFRYGKRIRAHSRYAGAK